MIDIRVGHVLDELRAMPDESVQCVVTSPPYWGLRNYNTPPVTFSDGWTGDHGLEPKPGLWVAHEVEIFHELRRVLRSDGTLFLNVGDSYASGNRGAWKGNRVKDATSMQGHQEESDDVATPPNRLPQEGLKDKDLCMMPARLALALQADGWYLRADIIWAKPNPMPESCRDRPTKSHEHIFLLTKDKRYFYDVDAIREESSGLTGGAFGAGGKEVGRLRNDAGQKRPPDTGGRNCRDVWRYEEVRDPDVWDIPTHAFPQAHFATFPPKLPERCIKAGTSERGCCPTCGTPWKRVVEKVKAEAAFRSSKYTAQPHGVSNSEHNGGVWQGTTRGWQPGCKCDAGEPVPCTVLDPFCGAGTTGLVADRLGRDFIGIELNPEYAEMARKRIRDDAPLFAAADEPVPEPGQYGKGDA